MNNEDFKLLVLGILLYFMFLIYPFVVNKALNLTISESILVSIYFVFVNFFLLILFLLYAGGDKK